MREDGWGGTARDRCAQRGSGPGVTARRLAQGGEQASKRMSCPVPRPQRRWLRLGTGSGLRPGRGRLSWQRAVGDGAMGHAVREAAGWVSRAAASASAVAEAMRRRQAWASGRGRVVVRWGAPSTWCGSWRSIRGFQAASAPGRRAAAASAGRDPALPSMRAKASSQGLEPRPNPKQCPTHREQRGGWRRRRDATRQAMRSGAAAARARPQLTPSREWGARARLTSPERFGSSPRGFWSTGHSTFAPYLQFGDKLLETKCLELF